ncbi:hypothetical protein EDC01DRAFT_630061 [Geopyxis carbonaria]|nr:hypothetical protein EDC01DRAFT_630061 [Geopyxis carbonaria]
MSGHSPPHETANPFADENESRSPSPRNSALAHTSLSSSNSSRGGSRPGSSGNDRQRGQQRVRFGPGEALDQLNNRTAFNLRDVNSSENLVDDPESYYLQSPVQTTSPETYNPPRITMPPRAFSYTSDKDEELELNEKYDQFGTHDDIAPQERKYGGSQSAPSSAQNSPTLNAFSVGVGQAQGAVPVDDIPLLTIGGNPTNVKSQDGGDIHRQSTAQDRPKVIATREAHDLVRQHTRRGGILGGKLGPPPNPTEPMEPVSGYATPTPFRHGDYVKRPEQYRGGVLGSLLSLYNNPQTGELPRHGHSHNISASNIQSPNSSGRTTPKWYSKSANASTSSLGGLLAASGSALMAPAAGTSARRERPKLKHRPHSGGGLADKLKQFSRPNLEEEIRITVHIADTIARQRYILKLCRALMLYGAPTHRLEEALKMSSRVLEIHGQFLYIPGCMVVSFGDQSTHTSEMHIVRSPQGVDLNKLDDTHLVYKEVVHDIISVEEATTRLDNIMDRKLIYHPWALVPVYGIASAVVGPFGFKARLIDMPVLFLMGCLLGVLQLIVAPRSDLYANVFEISAAIMTSFLARAFGSIKGGEVFCFSALAQASIALILPGYIILCGSLELQSKNIVAGSVRMFYAIVYSLFLGFGITIGSALYGLVDSNATSATTCQNPIEWKYNFIFVAPFALCLAIINQARLRQIPIMLFIAMAGYVVNFFSSRKFINQPQVANGIGAFAIGVLGNLYARIGHGLAFAAMLPAIFVQVPSGLAAQGSLMSGIRNADAMAGNRTASTNVGESNSLMLELGFSMIQVAIGITVGLFVAALVVYPFGKKRSGLFSF